MNALESKIPIDLRKALAASAMETAWKDLTPIARRDFITWVDGAKQPETRIRRIEKTCSVLAEGKRRPCCYAAVPMNLYKALGSNPKAKAAWKDLTPDGRRDLVSWIDGAKDTDARTLRIDKACARLASGKQSP